MTEGRTKVLLIAGDMGTRKVLSASLLSILPSSTIIEASSNEEGLKALRNTPHFDVVLTTKCWDSTTGLDLFWSLRESGSSAHLLFLSEGTDIQLSRLVRDLPGAWFVDLTFGDDHLLYAIRSALRIDPRQVWRLPPSSKHMGHFSRSRRDQA